MSDETFKSATQERDLKVTDKRMFTADGELREEYREEYRDIEAATAGEPADATDPAPPAASKPAPAPAQPAPPGVEERIGGPGARPVGASAEAAYREGPAAGPGAPGGPTADGAPMEIPAAGPGPAPGFLDLVALLAEPVALYLGDAELPDGRSAENLEAARLYIDLLDVVREKTVGNLSAQESAILEDVLYRLRMRYVQKRG